MITTEADAFADVEISSSAGGTYIFTSSVGHKVYPITTDGVIKMYCKKGAFGMAAGVVLKEVKQYF